MILDYLRRISHLRLFGSDSITRQNRDPPIEWNTDYEKQWRDECTRRSTAPNDDCTSDQHGTAVDQDCYKTPPLTVIDTSEEESAPATTTTDHIDKSCINASKPCIYVQPTAYQKQQCDQAVVGTQSTLLFNTKNRFERLLNILSHPDSEVIHDYDLTSRNERVEQSGKTAFLFELLKRLALLQKDFDIAVMTDDHDTESVIYEILRYHGYQCQRIPVILEDNWSNEHGVFFTTSEASYTKWSSRPIIDVIFMFDIRINNGILSKVDGDKRVIWVINKNTVEERAFSILQHESDWWKVVWRRNEALRNTMTETNTWDDTLTFDESVQNSADQAMDLLFPSNKRPRSPQSDTTRIPPAKRRPSIIILDSSDDEEVITMDEQPAPAPLDVNHFEICTTEVIDQLLDFPKVLNLARKNKQVTKAAMLSRELKDTVTAAEKALYTSLQPRLENIEARFQYEYDQLTDTLQRQYTECMHKIQEKYRREALDALDFTVATRDKQQPPLE